MRVKKEVIAVVLAISLSLIILSGCELPAKLDFSSEACSVKIDPLSAPESGILDYRWIDDQTLIVEAYITTTCKGASIEGDFEIRENQLILKYNVSPGEDSCMCPHKVIYHLSDLVKRRFTIAVIPE